MKIKYSIRCVSDSFGFGIVLDWSFGNFICIRFANLFLDLFIGNYDFQSVSFGGKVISTNIEKKKDAWD